MAAKRAHATVSISSRSPKKARVLDPVDSKVDLVLKTIADPACQVPGPKAHREMLLASIPHSLPVSCDDRHEFQTQLVQMVGQVVSDHVADWESQVKHSKAAVDAAAQKSTEMKNDADASAVMINVQEENVMAGKAIVIKDSEAVKAAENTLLSAKKDLTTFSHKLQKTTNERKHCASVYEECFTLLKSDHSVESAKALKLINKIESMLQKLRVEGSLLRAIVPALKKSPAARGPFDLMAVEEAEGAFTKHLAESQGQINEADALKTEKINAEAAAQKDLTAATEKRASSQAALKRAKDELTSLQTKHEELRKNVSEASKAESQALSHQASKEAGLTHAKDVLDAFTKLLELSN